MRKAPNKEYGDIILPIGVPANITPDRLTQFTTGAVTRRIGDDAVQPASLSQNACDKST
jgi:hypothetical protein